MVKDASVTVEDLIKQKICPSWWLPSTSLLKRCIPSFTETLDHETVKNTTVIIAAGETPTNNEVTGGILRLAITYLGQLIDIRGFSERIFSDLVETWWIVILGLLVATLVSFLWIFLMR